TSNAPAANVMDRGSGNRSGRTTEWTKTPTSRKPRKTRGGGKRTRAPPCWLCTGELLIASAGDHLELRFFHYSTPYASQRSRNLAEVYCRGHRQNPRPHSAESGGVSEPRFVNENCVRSIGREAQDTSDDDILSFLCEGRVLIGSARGSRACTGGA